MQAGTIRTLSAERRRGRRGAPSQRVATHIAAAHELTAECRARGRATR